MWVKIDDRFMRHPKFIAAGRDARDLYLAALCYCAENLTDGHVPAARLRLLAAEADIDNPQEAVKCLLDACLWEGRDDSGWQVHDYLEYQPSRDKALALKEARAEAGARGGQNKAASKTLAKDVEISTPSPSPSLSPTPVPDPGPEDAASKAGQAASPPAPAPSKRPKTPREHYDEAGMQRFYDLYPKKKDRQAVQAAWDKLRPYAELQEKILANVKLGSASRDWQEDDGKAIPYPATYLNNARWEDTYTAVSALSGHGSPRRNGNDMSLQEKAASIMSRNGGPR